VLKIHHSLTDGQGLVQLLSTAHSRTREPSAPATPPPPLPRGEQLTPMTLLASRLVRQATAGPGNLLHRAGGRSASPAGRSPPGGRGGRRDPLHPLPAAGARSPAGEALPVCCRATTATAAASWCTRWPLADLKAAGRAAGGSVNDAFLAALLGGFRRYHEHFGVPVDLLPMALPISLRTADDPAGGNRFAGARFAGRSGNPTPASGSRPSTSSS